MRVLLIGSGGREHALAWALNDSPLLKELFVAPGNAGIEEIARCVALDASDHEAVIGFCKEKGIDFVVVGPEQPLVAGLVDDLAIAGIKAFGPTRDAAQLEGSKGFTKDLCSVYGIPTAVYGRFGDPEGAKGYVRLEGAPIVIKADGLAGGKGVTIANTFEEAVDAIDACLVREGDTVVIEQMLVGEEASFFALVDGITALPLATAQDHKRAYDGDEGPNTGGMGAYSPAPVMTPELCERTMREIIRPTVEALAMMGIVFKGVLFAGLMITDEGPKLIEYNVRFGDPECQVLMLRLRSDLLAALLATADGVLADFDLRWSDDAALAVVMAASGYPGRYSIGSEIEGLSEAAQAPGVEIFHAGTRRDDHRMLAVGGRVLTVAATGSTVQEAYDRVYAAIDKIDWPRGFYRRDIGWRAIEREDEARQANEPPSMRAEIAE